MSESESDKLKKTKPNMKAEIDSVVDSIEKDQIENKSHEPLDESEIVEASEDPTVPDYAEKKAEGQDKIVSPTEGNPELESDPDPRFSKEYDSEEAVLRANRQKNAKSGGNPDEAKE